MTASTQYSDFQGSASAEFQGERGISSMMGLEDYAKSKGINTEQYNPIGISISKDQGGSVLFLIHCEDLGQEQSKGHTMSGRNFIVEDSLDSFFKKVVCRFDIVLARKGYDEASFDDFETE